MKNKKSILILLLVAIVSPLFLKIFGMPILITFEMVLLWFLLSKLKIKYAWIVLVILVLFNLNLNRLFYISINSINFSFDSEQSFFNYFGIQKSILRYKQEGLWLPYLLRNVFYSSYLKILPWLNNVAKMLSPLFWIRLLGFSGALIFVLGIISYFKNKFDKWYIGFWFLLVIISSSLRVLGDTVTAAYLTLPAIIYFIILGSKNKFFEKYQIYWYLLFLIDLILKW